MAAERLQVIALVSGGKDSFYSILHCMHHGHDVVALANLYPPDDGRGSSSSAAAAHATDPSWQSTDGVADMVTDMDVNVDVNVDVDVDGQRDLNSFMYQTVGHEVLPLYASATGIPLYRQPILGHAECHDRDYDPTQARAPSSTSSSTSQGSVAPAVTDDEGQSDEGQSDEAHDETESMVPLLRAIKARHPRANAVCSGAILSTYQRTRVESVALRLGLVPLSYLWKYPVLPPPLPLPPPPPPPPLPPSSTPSAAVVLGSSRADDAQLLRDMAAAGLEARVIKVASAGLDEAHLWQRVTSDAGVRAVQRALRRFGAAQGSTLGEGGEFETIVLDGPARLFKKRIAVLDDGRAVVAEGGGCSWLMLRGARVEDKPEGSSDMPVREPALLDARFGVVVEALSSASHDTDPVLPEPGALAKSSLLGTSCMVFQGSVDVLHRSFVADTSFHGATMEDETAHVVDKVRTSLSSMGRDAAQITNTIVVLRDINDFAKVNDVYRKLFTRPNPPSRVTISCSHVLPESRNIMIHIAMPDRELERGSRNGLHVQARSYWAPANIGPYSQAVDVPISSRMGLRSVHVAGQIPLLPATMCLPPPSEKSLQLQVALSLQHLWRIGIEMKVQCWTSAVAYFARPTSADVMKHMARLASRAWSLLHAPPDEEEEDDGGPDLWNLKYDPEYASMGSGDANTALPDWSIFTLQAQNEPSSCIPPMFAVEVESLPRQSDVEWHAHVGLGQVSQGCAEILFLPDIGGSGWRAWHMLVRDAGVFLVHTVIARGQAEESVEDVASDLEKVMAEAYTDSLKSLGLGAGTGMTEVPYLVYGDSASSRKLWQQGGDVRDGQLPFAYIPCHSIWSHTGEQMGCVALFRATMTMSR